VTLNNSGPSVTLTNLTDGKVAAGSKDAVTGNELFETNVNVSNVSNRVDNLNTNVTNNYNALNQNYNDLSQTVSNNYNTLNQSITNNVNTLTQNISNLTTNIGNGGIGPVQYSYAATPTTPNGGHKTNDLTLVGADQSAPVALHNVADGQISATSTDAVNGSQLYAYASEFSAGGNGLGVIYDDAGKTKVTLGGVGDTTNVSLTNVADGNVASGSKDAVNGGQLFETNSNVTNVSNRVDSLNTTVTNNYNALTQNYNDLSQTVSNNYNTLNQNITNLGSSLDALDQSAVTYDDSSHTSVTFNKGGTSVKLTNVAAGNLADNSTDAVNGGQLFQTNTNVSNISSRVDNLNTSVTNNYNTLSQNITNNYNTLTNNLGKLARDFSNGGVGPVQYSDASSPTTPNGGTPSNDLTLVGADPTQAVMLHNVAAGVIGAGSTDAINGSQINQFGSSLAGTLGGFTYNPVTNSFSGSFTYNGNSYSNVQAVFNAIGSGTSTGGGSGGGSGDTTDVASKYFHANSTMADSNAAGKDSTAIGPASTSTGSQSVAMGANAQAQSDQSVAIGAGAVAQDGRAVSIGQGNIASGNGAVALGDPSIATGDGAVVAGKDDVATGTGAIAMGNTSTAIGDGAVSLGNMNNANGLGSVALGSANTVNGNGAIAIGSNNSISGDNSLAIGSGVTTTASDALSIGNGSEAHATSAVAFGNRALATGLRAISVGTDTTATGVEAATFGTHADATNDYATAIGADAQANGLQSTALGNQAVAKADLTTAVGAGAQATTIYASAFGQMSTASGLASIAMGNASTATGYASAAIGTGSIADKDGSVALGVATQTVRGAVSDYSAFGLSDAQSSEGEVAIARNVSYLDPNTGQMTVTGNRQITGLAAGSAATDAVNVSQLRGVSSSLGISIASGLGGGSSYNSTTGAVTGPSYTLFGTTYNNVGDALQALAGYDVTNGGSGGNGIINPNIVTYSDSSHADVNLAGNGTQIHNLADGQVAAGSTDAVNGSQLAATNAQVAANTNAVSTLSNQVQNGAIGVVQYSNAATPTQGNGGTKTNDVTLVGANSAAPVALHNVADGQVAAGSTDAVNGSQLAATNAHVATVETTANAAMAMSQNSVQYDNGGSSVTLGGGGGSTPVALHNVADGTSANDAVNLGQLTSATNAAYNQSAAYTDRQIAAVRFDLGKVQKNANAGTAGALAMAGMPQPYEAGRGMIAMGAGTYQGQSAIAIGLAKALADEHTVVKLGATYDSRKNVGLSGGIGYQF
jgi:autotransporter adhesin